MREALQRLTAFRLLAAFCLLTAFSLGVFSLGIAIALAISAILAEALIRKAAELYGWPPLGAG
jgi:hypothetical protein